MDAMLQNRIQNLIGGDMPMGVEQYAEGGEVDMPGPNSGFETDLLEGAVEGLDESESMGMGIPSMAPSENPNQDLESAISELMMARGQTDDEGEISYIDGLIGAAEVGANAPMADLAMELSQAGRGGDVTLAHLRNGEIVLPPESMDDPAFESAVEKRLIELDIDPQAAVVGAGIASLNPITGLEEFGWFKKTWKSVKKVAKKVIKPLAKVAQFIPGPWQPIAALADKAFTVYDVAKGRASPLALATVAGPLATGGSFTKNIGDITKAGSGSFLGGIGKGLTGTAGSLRGGIGSLFSNPAQALTKDLPNLLKTANYQGMSPADRTADAVSRLRQLTQDPNVNNLVQGFRKAGMTPVQQIQALQKAGAGGSMFGNIFGGQTTLGNVLGGIGGLGGQQPMPSQQYQVQAGDTLSQIAADNGISLDLLMANNPHITDPNMIVTGQMLRLPGGTITVGAGGTGGTGGIGGIFSGGGADGVGNYGVIGDVLGGLTDKLGLTNYGGTAGTGASGSRGLGGLGTLGAIGAAGLLGKLAYDEAKNRKGVALTPLTQEGSTGRYNIEAEIARRTGQPAPNPVEYGLLPTGTIPTLSGGRPTPRAEETQQPVMTARYGGAVMPMAYAKGGNVATEDFERMNGGINGEGTETSDDVPAMLSDGEFVMTGQAVRGAGAFDLSKGKGGIITLTPNGGESREGGTALMYEMMDLFAEFADKPKSKRAAA
jgi:LysM repeat protein